MPKDSYYIKLDTNAYEDPKVKVLCKYHGNMFGFGSYLFLALKLRQEENCRLEYGDFTFEALSVDMGKSPEEVKKFIDDCIRFKLFQKDGTHFYSDRINRDKARLDEIRQKTSHAGRVSAEKRYGKPAETGFESNSEIVYTEDGQVDEHKTLICNQPLWKVKQVIQGEIEATEANKKRYRYELKRLGIKLEGKATK